MQNKTIPFRTSKKPHPLFLFIIAIIITALLPSSLLANADKIFKENNNAVVVVVAYNAKGEPISQGSGVCSTPLSVPREGYHNLKGESPVMVKARSHMA